MTYDGYARWAAVQRRFLSRVLTILFAVAILALSVVGERWLLLEAPASGIEIGIAKGFAAVSYTR